MPTTNADSSSHPTQPASSHGHVPYPYGGIESYDHHRSSGYYATNVGHEDISYYPNSQLILLNLSSNTTPDTVIDFLGIMQAKNLSRCPCLCFI